MKALSRGSRDRRLSVADALLGEPLSAEEVAALCPVLEEVASARSDQQSSDGADPGKIARDLDLALRLVQGFGQARWRHALPSLVALFRETPEGSPLHRAMAETLEAVQPGLTDPLAQVSDTATELQDRTIMEQGLLARAGMPALKNFLERMPLCGAFATVDMPHTPAEEALRTRREQFADRRLRQDPDASGTLEEITQHIIAGLYAVAADLGKKRRGSERAIIQPHTKEGIPGLAEVRTIFGAEFAYVDLVARCDRDWFYYWGTER